MNTTNKILMSVVDEEHWMKPGETQSLDHKNVVPDSFASNHPLQVDYENGIITTLTAAGLRKNGFEAIDSKEPIPVLVSYCYWTEGHSGVVNDDKTTTPIDEKQFKVIAEGLRKAKSKEYRETYDKEAEIVNILRPILGKTIGEDEFMKAVEQIKAYPRIPVNVSEDKAFDKVETLIDDLQLDDPNFDQKLDTIIEGVDEWLEPKIAESKKKAPKSIEPSLIEDETEVLIEARKSEDAMLRVEKEIEEQIENDPEGKWELTEAEKQQIEAKKVKPHTFSRLKHKWKDGERDDIKSPLQQLPHRRIGSPEWKEWIASGKIGGSRSSASVDTHTNDFGKRLFDDELSSIAEAVNYEMPKPHIPIAHNDLANILELNMLLMDALLDGGIMNGEQKTTLTIELRKALIQKALRSMTRTIGEMNEDRSMPKMPSV